MPTGPDGQSEEQALPQMVAVPPPRYRWFHKFFGILFVAFCLAVGLFLLIFPWTDSWDSNYFATWIPEWHAWWDNLYVRGAISGVGVVNLVISFAEMFRLRRFSDPQA
jgi:hypothetical protein